MAHQSHHPLGGLQLETEAGLGLGLIREVREERSRVLHGTDPTFGRPRGVEYRAIDFEWREVIEIERLVAQSAKLVLDVRLVVLQDGTTLELLQLPDRVAVLANLEIPNRRSPRVVLIAPRLVPPTLEVPQCALSPSFPGAIGPANSAATSMATGSTRPGVPSTSILFAPSWAQVIAPTFSPFTTTCASPGCARYVYGPFVNGLMPSREGNAASFGCLSISPDPPTQVDAGPVGRRRDAAEEVHDLGYQGSKRRQPSFAASLDTVKVEQNLLAVRREASWVVSRSVLKQGRRHDASGRRDDANEREYTASSVYSDHCADQRVVRRQDACWQQLSSRASKLCKLRLSDHHQRLQRQPQVCSTLREDNGHDNLLSTVGGDPLDAVGVGALLPSIGELHRKVRSPDRRHARPIRGAALSCRPMTLST